MPTRIEEFEGRWLLTKEITDRRGPEARFEGDARIEEGPTAWAYVETGTLTLGAGEGISAERRYCWTASTAGIEVAFDDGRPFHVLPLTGGDALHDCPPDTYRVRYDFGGWPLHWTATWHVTGPRKDYDMVCRYQR